MNAIEKIKNRQFSWAKERKICIDKDGYVDNLSDNLFEPLKQEVEREFNSGHGKELDGKRAKMKALHSSSALVCNFFHYWRFRDLDLILKVLEIESSYTGFKFEKKHTKPSEIKGIPPHLDVEINTKPFAIESKFTEPYTKKRKTMKPIYGRKSHLWDPLCSSRRLVDNIISGKEIFEYLDVPQLLKHILGLKTDYGPGGFKLLYLWYKVDSIETIKHEDEIRRFISYVSSEVEFYCFTYQELFAKLLRNVENRDRNYISYMKSRYF